MGFVPEDVRTTEVATFKAHINLKEEYLPYKYLIGQIILDVGNFLCVRPDHSLLIEIEKHSSQNCGK